MAIKNSSNHRNIQVGSRQYQLSEKLGKGGLSVVHKGVCSKSGQEVALKIIPQRKLIGEYGLHWKKTVAKEVRLCKDLRHKHLIRLLGYDCRAMNNKALIFVQEIAEHGELFDFVKANSKFAQPAAIGIFRQIMLGLQELHKNGIAHRDIKLENLLVGEDFNIKLADFSFSARFKKFKKNPIDAEISMSGGGANSNTTIITPSCNSSSISSSSSSCSDSCSHGLIEKKCIMDTRLGTQGYMAPEIGRGEYDEKIDIYAAGVVLFILLAGFPPFAKTSSLDWWFHKLKQKNYAKFWRAHERNVKFSDEAKVLIQGMLEVDPKDRWTLEQVMESDFLILSECLNNEELVQLFRKIKETKLNTKPCYSSTTYIHARKQQQMTKKTGEKLNQNVLQISE